MNILERLLRYLARAPQGLDVGVKTNVIPDKTTNCSVLCKLSRSETPFLVKYRILLLCFYVKYRVLHIFFVSLYPKYHHYG